MLLDTIMSKQCLQIYCICTSTYTKWIHVILQQSSDLVKEYATTPKAYPNSFENFSYDVISFLVKKSFNIQELLHH
jgi:hypothetical protein